MVRKEVSPEKTDIDYGAIIEFLFLIVGISLIILGSIGFILTVLLYSKIYDDQVLLTSLNFSYFYTIVLGLMLFAYHKKIWVKARRT